MKVGVCSFSDGIAYLLKKGIAYPFFFSHIFSILKYPIKVQWNLDLRKPDLRKNLDLRNIVGTTDFLVHKLFDLRKIFKPLNSI